MGVLPILAKPATTRRARELQNCDCDRRHTKVFPGIYAASSGTRRLVAFGIGRSPLRPRSQHPADRLSKHFDRRPRADDKTPRPPAIPARPTDRADFVMTLLRVSGRADVPLPTTSPRSRSGRWRFVFHSLKDLDRRRRQHTPVRTGRREVGRVLRARSPVRCRSVQVPGLAVATPSPTVGSAASRIASVGQVRSAGEAPAGTIGNAPRPLPSRRRHLRPISS